MWENHKKTRLGKQPRPILVKRRKKKNLQMMLMYRRFHCDINLPDFWYESSEISGHACVWKSAKHTLVIVVVVVADNEKKNYID